MVRYLVTGGAGFIGSNLAEALVRAGQRVRILDNIATGARANLTAGAVELLEGDLRDAAIVERAARRPSPELVEYLNHLLGKRLEPAFAPPRPGDVRHSQADLTRAAALLGYQPTVELQEGLARTAAAMMSHE